MLNSIPPCIRRVRWLPRVLAGLPLVLVLGCHGNDLAPPLPPDLDSLFWDLRLDHQAVTLSTTQPYDTLTVTATPRNYAGEPLIGLPAPVYTTSDPRAVLVMEDGRLQARPHGGVAMITATLTVDNVKHRDTVYVLVVDNPTPPVLGRVSIHPLLPDSAKRAVAGFLFANPYLTPMLKPEADIPLDMAFSLINPVFPFPVRVTDTANNPIPAIVHLESADRTMATFYSDITGSPFPKPWISPLKPGVVTLYATATMFGVTKADTLQYEVGWPLAVRISSGPSPTRGPGNFFINVVNNAATGGDGEAILVVPAQVRIATGGVVGWRGDGTDTTEVVFDDPTHVRAYETLDVSLYNPAQCDAASFTYPVGGCSAAGNFVLLPGQYAYRAFPVPGIYPFHNARNGARGQIVVGD